MQNKYEVLGIVGEGAYGIVYKCKNKENGEFVAIKKFKETQDEIVKKTMARELRVLQMLKNDNIVEYKGAFKRKENLFLVFEYVEKNLLELLQEHPKGLDPNLIKKIIYQVCKSINYLHEQNIVHRDIKPENLLVDSNNKLKLCDFGFARSIKTAKDNLTDYVATRWYRSPELLLTSGSYGPEVDNWSIGCIMGELTDGDPLFPGDNEVDQLIVIQKVIGKFTDEQCEMFSKNPHFSGYNLPEVTKPETLERRYMGKLSKHAINFMKQLLNPDPKLRLKGEDIFKHPYFENYPDPFPSHPTINCDTHTSSIQTIYKQTNSISSLTNGAQPHPSVVNKSITLSKEIAANIQNQKLNCNSISNSVEKADEKQRKNPIVTNTTNINIINYNNYENKLEKFEKMEKEKNKKFINTINNFSSTELGPTKSLSKGKQSNVTSKNFGPQDNLMMTSSNFNKNLKENILSLYGTASMDKNFKTFYPKDDKYSYDIDYNFKKHEESKSLGKKEKEKGKATQKFTMKTNNIIPEEEYGNLNISNNLTSNFHNNNIYCVNNKASPPKYSNVGYGANSNLKTKAYFYQNNLQLPSINSTTNKAIKPKK